MQKTFSIRFCRISRISWNDKKPVTFDVSSRVDSASDLTIWSPFLLILRWFNLTKSFYHKINKLNWTNSGRLNVLGLLLLSSLQQQPFTLPDARSHQPFGDEVSVSLEFYFLTHSARIKMVTSCEIRFDNNPNATFQSGSTLTGTVVLNLSEKKKFRGEVIV